MRLLLVEDYDLLRESLSRGLTAVGYDVDATGDGEQGKWYALNHAYDLLLLDITVPTIGGLEILRQVRAAGHDVPVLLLTARDGVEDRHADLDGDADDHLSKPFGVAELLVRIRALIRRRQCLAHPRIAVGDLEIDTVAHSVHRCGHEVILTPREYSLLEYLGMHAGAVVTRSELSERLNELTGDPDSNAVDVFVSRLRRKLAVDGRPAPIATRRGFGYMLTEACAQR